MGEATTTGQSASASPRWEVVNRDTDEVVATYVTRAEANAHIERFPNDRVRPIHEILERDPVTGQYL